MSLMLLFAPQTLVKLAIDEKAIVDGEIVNT